MFNLFAPNTKVIVESDGAKKTIKGDLLRTTIYTLNAFKRNYTLTYLHDGSEVKVEFKNKSIPTKTVLENEISEYKNQIAALENLHGATSKEKYELQKHYQSEINIRRDKLNESGLLPKSILDIPVKAEIVTVNSF